MSSASLKKLAARNKAILDQLFYISILINLLSLIAVFYFKRPSSGIYYLVFSVPSVVLQYLLETNGRPIYDSRQQLVKSGDDILQRGSLFQYCFDVIYITWFFDALMIIFGSNKTWLGYGVIPGFIVYKLGGYILPFFKKSGGGSSGDESGANGAASRLDKKEDSGLSKRQQKLKARKEKGPAVKYR
ncbi:uncharacterized protein LODBEIA_P27600 [Lodderomyces beijingensis]|uniref:DUF788-domain-containing protein n=1 Tax=Lodderomyces beijingensis TaxID=1775926 RepID=A0ABP0ZNR0_9ASCO